MTSVVGLIAAFGGQAGSALSVAGFNTSVQSGTGSTSQIVSLPTGIVAGELLLVVIGAEGDRSYTWPAGWTELADSLNGTISSATIGYRTATGSEGSTMTVTSSSGTGSAHVAMRISGSWATPTISTLATGSNTTPDPNSVTSAVSREKLWLPVAAGRLNNSLAGVSPPSGYTTVASSSYVSGGVGSFATVASLISSSNTLNPGIFSLSTGSNADWLAWTIVV
jgi:hypothetical protein